MRSQLVAELRSLGYIRSRGSCDIRGVNIHSDSWPAVKGLYLRSMNLVFTFEAGWQSNVTITMNPTPSIHTAVKYWNKLVITTIDKHPSQRKLKQLNDSESKWWYWIEMIFNFTEGCLTAGLYPKMGRYSPLDGRIVIEKETVAQFHFTSTLLHLENRCSTAPLLQSPSHSPSRPRSSPPLFSFSSSSYSSSSSSSFLHKPAENSRHVNINSTSIVFNSHVLMIIQW